MPSLSLEFEVFCACGKGLCNNVTEEKNRGGYTRESKITLEPCEECLEKAREEGYEQGCEDGYDKAQKEQTA